MTHKSFAHFVLIRFSVPIGYGKAGVTTNEEWLRYRWRIFNEITFPSLMNQTEKDFRILVFFDAKSPKWLMDVNAQLHNAENRYIPIYVDSHEDSLRSAKEYIFACRESEKFDYIITSRIDSDDAYHKDAIRVIQNEFDSSDHKFIIFSKLLCFRKIPTILITGYKYKFSPFASLIEAVYKQDSDPFIIFYYNHTSHRKAKHIFSGFYALQYIHGDNVTNDIIGLAQRNINLIDYGIKERLNRAYFPMLIESLRMAVRARIKDVFRKLKNSTKKRACEIRRLFQ